jgi:RimJ/RimL family protein N-acetyltransferase
VDRLDTAEFIGFIGLADQDYEADFTPCVDIGWRLKRSAWHNGFATEGAQRCLSFAFNEIGIDRVYAVAPKVNLRSEHIMQLAGMRKLEEFSHPRLLDDDRLRGCILYGMDRNGFRPAKTEIP